MAMEGRLLLYRGRLVADAGTGETASLSDNRLNEERRDEVAHKVKVDVFGYVYIYTLCRECPSDTLFSVQASLRLSILRTLAHDIVCGASSPVPRLPRILNRR